MAGSASTALLAGSGMPDTAQAQANLTPALAPVPFNWTGFYIGVHAGGIWSDEDNGGFGECGPFENLVGEDGEGSPLLDCYNAELIGGPNDGSTFPSFDLDDDYVAWTGGEFDRDRLGGLGGGFLGVNRQYGNLIVGLEGDFSGVFGHDSKGWVSFDYFHDKFDFLGIDTELSDYEGTGTVSFKESLEWLSTIRGRIGAALGPDGRAHLYGTAGLAIAGVDSAISGDFDDSHSDSVGWCDGGCFFDDGHDGDDVRLGIAAGAGGEYAFGNNLFGGLEYLFVHFDEESNSITFHGDDGRSFDIKQDSGIENIHIVRARLGLLFGSP